MKTFFLITLLGIIGCLIGVSWILTEKPDTLNAIGGSNIVSLSPSNEEPLFRFIVFGDNEGNLPVMRKILERAQKEKVDFILNTGDTTPGGATKEFQDYARVLQDFNIPIYDTAGNDDIGTDGTLDLYHQYLEPKTYYSFDKDQYHFVSIYNVGKSALLPQQLTWLKKDLDNNKDKKIVLFFHKPINLPYADIVEYDDFIPDERVAQFTSLIANYPIVQMFAGHAHTYFSYTVNNIPLAVTGGGGGEANVPAFFQLPSPYHVVMATATKSGITTEVIPIE